MPFGTNKFIKKKPDNITNVSIRDFEVVLNNIDSELDNLIMLIQQKFQSLANIVKTKIINLNDIHNDSNFVSVIKNLDNELVSEINTSLFEMISYNEILDEFLNTLNNNSYNMYNKSVKTHRKSLIDKISDIKESIPKEQIQTSNSTSTNILQSIDEIPNYFLYELNEYNDSFKKKKENYIANLIQKYIGSIQNFNDNRKIINKLDYNNNKNKFNESILDNIRQLKNKFNQILINKTRIFSNKDNLELNNYVLNSINGYNNLQIKFNSTIDELINKFEYIIDKLMGIKSQILSNFKSQSTSIEPLQTSNEGFIGKFKENENVKYRNLNGKIHNVQFAKYLDTNRANIYTNEDKSKTKTVLISQLSKINSPIEKVSELNNNPSVVISSKSVNGPVPTSSITNSSLNSIGSNVISSQNNQISSSNTLQTSNEGLVRNFKLNENVLYNNGTEKYHAKFNKYFGKNGAIIKYRNTNGKNKTPYVKISQLSKINSPIEKVSGLNNNSSVVISSKSVNLPLSTSRITNSSLNPIGSNVGVGVNQEGNTSEPIISSTESGSKSSNKLITNTGKGKEEKQQENSSPIASALSMQSNTKPDIKKGNKFKGLNKNGKNENYTYNVIDYANFKENMNNGKVQQNSFKPENISSVKNSNISFKSEKGNRYFVRRSNDKTTSRSINRLKKILNQTI